MATKAADRVGKLQPISFRTTPEIRAFLEKSASANGRSLSQEIEARIDASHIAEQVVQRFFGGEKTHTLFMNIASNLKSIEEKHGARWFEAPDDIAEKIERDLKRALSSQFSLSRMFSVARVDDKD